MNNKYIPKSKYVYLSHILNDCVQFCVPTSDNEPLSSILQKICNQIVDRGEELDPIFTSSVSYNITQEDIDNWNSGSSTVTIYTGDGEIEEDRTVDLLANNIVWDNNSLFKIRDDSVHIEEYSFGAGFLFENTDPSNSYKTSQNLTDGIYLGWNNVPLTSSNNLQIKSTGTYLAGLTNLVSQDRLVGQDGATNQLGYITIGSDLSISGGLLSFSGSGNYIQNQFAGAQSASAWIGNNLRVDGYTQIGVVGRLVDDIGTLSVVTPTTLDEGTNFRVKRLLFYRDATPTLSSTAQIYSGNTNVLNFDSDGIVYKSSGPNSWYIENPTTFRIGNDRPFVIGGETSNNSGGNVKEILNIYNEGDAVVGGLGQLSHIGYSGNVTTTGRVTLVKAGGEMTDSGTSTYKGDWVIYTANAAAPSERFRINHLGHVTIKTLDTDLTAPTTTGTVRMVTCDTTGLLSFQAIPSGAGAGIDNQIAAAQTANFWVSGYSAIGSSAVSTIKFTISDTEVASTASRTGVTSSMQSSFNTTSSSLNAIAINATISSTRSSGANALINTAIMASASGGQTNYSAYFDSGDILMNSLANTTSQDRLVGQDSSSKIIDYVTIGSGLSLSSGVLSASPLGSLGLQEILDVDPVLTGAEIVDAGGFNFGIENVDDLTFENSGQLFLKVAGHGAATLGDVLTITNLTTGEVAWAANGVGAGGSVTSFSAGTLSPLFTTSVATATSTPALSFILTNAGANTYFGNATGSAAAPSYTSAAALSKTDDTNVTLTLGGNPTTSLLRAASLTLGWSGQLAIGRGGTGLSALGTALQNIRVNAGATALEYYTPTISTQRLSGRNTAGTGAFEEVTTTQAIDWIGSTQGNILYRGAASWSVLAPGTAGQILTTGGAAANPQWTTFSLIATQPAAGLTITGSPIGSSGGTLTFALAGDLAALEALATTGIVRRTGASTWTTGTTVGIAEGGTGLTAIPTNGQFLIGNGTNYTLATLTGTTNQITVTSGAGSSTLSLPQNIHTAATPQFARIGLGTAASTAYAATLGGSGYTLAGLGVSTSTSAQIGADGYVAFIAGTIVEAASGTHPMLASLALSPAIVTVGAATVTNTATLYVNGASSATVTGANYAIYSASGTNRFIGDVIGDANNVNSTNNYDYLVRNQSTGRYETVASDVVVLNSQTGATYTLVLTDKGKLVQRNNGSANTTTIPTNASVAFPIGTTILVWQEGAGQTTVTPSGGVTLTGADNAFKTRVQGSIVTIIKTGTNTWLLTGDSTV